MLSRRWLGQNSKQTKLSRQLTDVQARMRLKVSGDKSEIRQSYIPSLFPHIVQPLMEKGAVRVLRCARSYPFALLTYVFSCGYRAPWTRRLSSWTSTSSRARTGTRLSSLAWVTTRMRTSSRRSRRRPRPRSRRSARSRCLTLWGHVLTCLSRPHRYNSRDHPVAFHKAEALGKVPKKIAAAGPAPDLEEAFDVSS